MNVFGVGPAEALVILIVALVFVGPERLPRLAADIARTIREIRKYTGEVAAEFNEVIKDLDKETAGDRSEWKEITEGLSGATKSLTDSLRAARSDLDAAGTARASTPPSVPAAPPPPAEAAWREIPEPGVPPPPANDPAQAVEEPR
jgi:sec-independent protein translocase protein TatB